MSKKMSHLGWIPWTAPRRKVCQQNTQPCPLTLAPVPARRTLGCVTGWSIHGDFMPNHCWEPVTFLWKVPLTHWWQQCPIFLLSPMAAAMCSGKFILRRWRTALTLPALLMNCILNISCYCRLQAAYRNYTINLVTATVICLGWLLAGTKTAHGMAGVTQTRPQGAGECSTSALDPLSAPSLFLKTNWSKVDHL